MAVVTPRFPVIVASLSIQPPRVGINRLPKQKEREPKN